MIKQYKVFIFGYSYGKKDFDLGSSLHCIDLDMVKGRLGYGLIIPLFVASIGTPG